MANTEPTFGSWSEEQEQPKKPVASKPAAQPTFGSQSGATATQAKEDFSSAVPASRAPARTMEEWKKDPSRGFSFGTREEQKSAALGNVGERALSGTGAFADAFTLGGLNWVPAYAAKGAGAIGVPGYERFSDMPVSQIKKEADKITAAAQTNRPVESAVGTTAGLGAAMMTQPSIAAPKFVASPLGRSIVGGGLTGLAYGAGEGFLREGDVGDAAESGVKGLLAGSTLTPALEKSLGAVSRFASSMRPIVDRATGQLSPAAMRAAQEAGLSQEQIAYLGDHLVDAFKQYGMRPEAVRAAQFAREGLTPTVGMVTRNADQLAREAKFGEPAYTRLSEEAAGAAQVASPTQVGPIEAAEAAAQRIKDTASARMAASERAYKKATSKGGVFDVSAVQDLGSNLIKDAASDPNNLKWIQNSSIRKAAGEIDNVLGAPLETSAGEVTHSSFDAVENARQILNRYYREATDQDVRFGLQQMIGKFDERIENAINNNLYSGDPKALQAWKNARKLWSNYQKQFGIQRTGPESGSLVRQIVNENKSPEAIANMLFNVKTDKALKSAAAKILNQLKTGLGSNSQEYEKIRAAYVNKIMTPEGVGPKAYGNIANQIEDFLSGSTREVSRSMLSQNERFALEQYAKVMRMAAENRPQDYEKSYGLIKSMLLAGGATVGSGILYNMSILDPKFATAMMVAGAVPATLRAAHSNERYQRMLANKLFSGRGPTPAVPSAGVVTPRIYPGMEPENEERADGGRVARASGGQVSVDKGVRALMMAVEQAKKKVSQSTESLLEQPDEHIAQALSMAKRHI